MIIVISGPSGVGKGTVISKLLNLDSKLTRVVTCTTRKPRKGEVNGKDYFFLTPEEFFKKVRNNELVEFAFVHGNYYGTPKIEVESGLEKNRDVVLQIDVQGAKKIKNSYPDALLIFLLPPDMKVLKERLSGRGTETEEEKELRLKRAEEEIEERVFYDYIVVNDDLDKTVSEIMQIIKEERSKRSSS
jgi:guanylate kinase